MTDTIAPVEASEAPPTTYGVTFTGVQLEPLGGGNMVTAAAERYAAVIKKPVMVHIRSYGSYNGIADLEADAREAGAQLVVLAAADDPVLPLPYTPSYALADQFVPDALRHDRLVDDWRYVLGDTVPIVGVHHDDVLFIPTLHVFRRLGRFSSSQVAVVKEALASATMPLATAEAAARFGEEQAAKHARGRAMVEAERWLADRASASRNRVERNIYDTRRAFEQYIRDARSANLRLVELQATLDGLSNINPDHSEELKRLRNLLDGGVVTDIKFRDETVIFSTRTLYVQDDRTQAWHELGKYTVRVKMDDGEIRFENLTRRVDAYNSGMQHPHIWEDGTACAGNFADMRAHLMATNDWLTLIEVTIAFLESVNVSDPAGSHVHRWPFVEDPASVGLPAYEGEVFPKSTSSDYEDENEDEPQPFEDNGGREFIWDWDQECYLHNGVWRESGVHIDTGTYYDEDGLDWDGEPEFPPITDDNGYTFYWDFVMECYLHRDSWDQEYNHINTGTKYDTDGYNINGYDADGYDEGGYNAEGHHRDQAEEG